MIIAVFQPDETGLDPAGHTAMSQTWAPLGVNTALLVPDGDSHDPDGWNYRAGQAGLKVIRATNGKNPRTNLPDPSSLVALASDLCPDEPEYHDGDPAALAAETVTLAAAFPGVPQYQCLSGGKLLGLDGQTFTDAQYKQILHGKRIVATDFYPVTGWGNPNFMGRWVDLGARLKSLADPEAELMAILEMSGQNLPFAPAGKDGANPSQIRAQAALALIAGFKHLGWFAIRPPVGGWSFDSSTPGQKAAVKAVNDEATKYADFIARGTLKATVAAPKYQGEWTLDGQTLTIAVDLTDTTHPTTTLALSAPGAVASAGGTSTPTPTPPPVATPSVTPAPTPTPAVTPLPWTLARDLKRGRWQVQLPPTQRGKPNRYALVTDPADVALLDAIASKYPAK